MTGGRLWWLWQSYYKRDSEDYKSVHDSTEGHAYAATMQDIVDTSEVTLWMLYIAMLS